MRRIHRYQLKSFRRVGWGDNTLATMSYGENFKQLRKLMHEGMNPKAIEVSLVYVLFCVEKFEAILTAFLELK